MLEGSDFLDQLHFLVTISRKNHTASYVIHSYSSSLYKTLGVHWNAQICGAKIPHASITLRSRKTFNIKAQPNPPIHGRIFHFSFMTIRYTTTKTAPRRENGTLYTSVVLFFFSFCSKTSASARKKNLSIFFIPYPYLLRWRSISPPRFLFFITRARQTEKRK